MERIAGFVYRRAKLIIAVVVILNIASLASFYRFSLETDFLALFSQGNPRAEEYNQLNEKYQSGEVISILIEHDESLLARENLLDIYRIQEQVQEIDGVSLVQGFIPPEILVRGRVIPISEEMIENNYETLMLFIQDKYFLTDQFLSSDGRSGMIVATLDLNVQAGEVVESLKNITENEDHLTLSLAGNEIIKDTLWSYLMTILFILPPCAIILVLLVFYLVLRKRKFAALALVPAGLAALWTFGTIFWSGQELSLVTVISPLFIIIIGSAYGLHFVSHFLDNIHRYPDRRQLTVETMRMVGVPIFLATVTTMAGFASLTWTSVVAMRQMGIFVTLGIAFAGFMALFFLPAVLSRIKLPAQFSEAGESRLSGVVLSISRRRTPIVLAFLVIVAVSAVYIPRLEVMSNQLMFFKEGSEIRQTFDKVEGYFGGAMPLAGEIISENGPLALTDHEFATRVLAVERELEELTGSGSVFSVFDLLQGINKMATGQDVYPQDPVFIQSLVMQMGQEGLGTWISEDGFRMMIRPRHMSSLDVGKLDDFAVEHKDTIRAITGMPVLFDEMNRLVVQSQIQSLGLALGLIFLMLLLTLRKLKAALVGMLPITVTITAILGVLALTKFQLNIMTANLSAIAIGVGVDYSIHLLSGIYYFRRQGLAENESVNSALVTVSRPVLANAFGLAIGLSVMFFSPLRIHFQVASVMWVAMIVSSAAALLLIPLFYSRGRPGRVN